MPFDAALELVETHLKDENRGAIRHLQSCYHSSLGLYANGGKPPPAPKIDEDDL